MAQNPGTTKDTPTTTTTKDTPTTTTTKDPPTATTTKDTPNATTKNRGPHTRSQTKKQTPKSTHKSKKRKKDDDSSSSDSEQARKKKQKTNENKRTQVRKPDSIKLVNLYSKHKKNWTHFFADEEVKEIILKGKYDETQIQHHINYLKRKVADNSNPKGTKHRDNIFSELDECESSGNEAYSAPLSPLNQDDEEPEELGSQRLQILDGLEQEMLDDVAISSSDIQDSEDYETFQEKQSDKRKLRSSRIAKKAEERQQMVSLMREQTESQAQSNQMRVVTSALVVQMMQKAISAFDTNNTVPTNAEMEKRITEISNSTTQKLTEMENKINSILNILQKNKQ